jgi:NAD(P)-dependent dehydrogenase (short-subunit alcohol dehydrogenase family)
VKIDLNGQVVVVTGAGRGIGREIALMSAEAGARVVLAARTAAQLEDVVAAVTERGGEALAVPTDVTDPAACERLIEAPLERWGRLDVLVNNAGTNVIASLVMSKEEQWRSVYEVNVFAVFRLTKLALKPMIRAKSGRVINISSVSEKAGAAFASTYASSKGAVNAFTRSVALETAKLGITVNSVNPWHVHTDLLEYGMGKRGAMFGASAEDYIKKIAEGSPQARLVEAREIAATALFLMSREAAAITGQSLNVSGGAVMNP